MYFHNCLKLYFHGTVLLCVAMVYIKVSSVRIIIGYNTHTKYVYQWGISQNVWFRDLITCRCVFLYVACVCVLTCSRSWYACKVVCNTLACLHSKLCIIWHAHTWYFAIYGRSTQALYITRMSTQGSLSLVTCLHRMLCITRHVLRYFVRASLCAGVYHTFYF